MVAVPANGNTIPLGLARGRRSASAPRPPLF